MMGTNRTKALLALADGTVFEGLSFGASGETTGEVVFNTSMTGYQEIITDPSYKGQIVVMTYPQMGNYGVNSQDRESKGPHVEGFVVRESFGFPSSWRSEMSLPRYLEKNRIIGIERIDTRALTRHIRDKGVQMGIISTEDLRPQSLVAKARQLPDISSVDLVGKVTAQYPYKWTERVWRWQPADTGDGISKFKVQGCIDDNIKLSVTPDIRHPSLSVAVYDFGVKLNILRHLVEEGFDVTVVPALTPAEEVLGLNPDGIVLSNGPGDPQTVLYAMETAKKLLGKKPVLGICLGHQILGLAFGGRTYKLKFGHHGGNHPVMDLSTRTVEITAQNHNYCVDIESLKGQVELTHRNLYDGTEEGMMHKGLPVFSVQYHPEAGPGPNDSCYLFRRFREMIERF